MQLPDDRDALVDALGPAIQRVVRTFAVVFAVGITAAGAVRLPRVPAADVVPILLALGAALALSFFVARLPLTDHPQAARNQRWIPAYPGAIVLLAVAYEGLEEPLPTISLFVLTVLVLGALTSRPRIAWSMALVAVAGNVVAVLGEPEPDWMTTITFTSMAFLATWIANVAGLGYRRAVLEQLRAHRKAEHRANELGDLVQAAREAQTLDADELLQSVADSTRKLDWDMCGIYVPAPDDDGYVLGGHQGINGDVVRYRQEPIGVFGDVLRTGESVVYRDYQGHPGANPNYPELQLAVGAPIAVHGKLRGVIVVGRTTDQLDDFDVHLLELLATQAGRAIEIAEQYEAQTRSVTELRRLNELKRDFIGTVSHELRTPLQVVQGVAETLHERWPSLDEATRKDLTGRLTRNAGELHDVIVSLLDFARLEQRNAELVRRSVRLDDVLRQVMERTAERAREHRVVLDLADPARSAEVWADAALLERVVEDLVSNALVHTPPGTSVWITAQANGQAVVFEVRDDGPGIRPEELERLGERFFRGGSPLHRTTRGLGLGLASCVEILARHGSRLEVDSVVGSGTRFWFRLPTSEDAPEAAVNAPRS